MPYWLMTSTGSTTLPIDLLILRPCPSLTCKGHAQPLQAMIPQCILQHSGPCSRAREAAAIASIASSSEAALAA